MSEQDWSVEISLLQSRGFDLAPGLTDDEFHRVETLHGLRFPPDLRSFLSCALPIGKRFPNWRDPESESILDQLGWPFKGMAFDIEHNVFWWPAWGERPAAHQDAISVARTAFESVPKMIPVYGHRYLPAEPETAGNPVFSIYQTDIIYYGLGLRRYFACEFGALSHEDAIRGEPRFIRFWTDLVGAAR